MTNEEDIADRQLKSICDSSDEQDQKVFWSPSASAKTSETRVVH